MMMLILLTLMKVSESAAVFTMQWLTVLLAWYVSVCL